MTSNTLQLKAVGIFLLKLLCTCAFLYWALSQIEDRNALKMHFFQALQSPVWLISGLFFAGVSILAGAFRYYLLLRAQSIPVSFAHIVKLSFISALFNIASLGVAAGDAVKMIGVMRRHPHKKIPITMALIMDHLVGFVSGGIIFLVFAWGGGIIDQVSQGVVRQALIYGTIFQLISLALIALMFFTSSENRHRWIRSKFPRLTTNRHIESMASAVDTFQNQKKVAALALATSMLLSLSFFMSFYVALRTVDDHAPLGPVLTVMPVVDVASALPISISGLGVREKTFEFFLSELTDISPGAAVSASLIGFLFHVFWGLIGGVLLLFEKNQFYQKQKRVL